MRKSFPAMWRGPQAERVATSIAYAIFFLTGAAVVLPGTLLPLLARQWHLGDGAAGVFFLCFSVGSSGGSLLSRGGLSRALSAGCLLVGCGAALLVSNIATGAVLLLLIAVYGCGLGLAMTSISLLQSRRRPEHRVMEMARLNLIWAIGAGVAPSVLLRCAVRYGTPAVLHAAAGIALVSAFLVLAAVPSVKRAYEPRAHWLHSIRSVPLVLLCIIPLATGVESGMSGWLSSYIMRGGFVLNVTIGATTAFGVGLILSRLVHSHRRDEARSTRIILNLHPVLMVLGIALLMFSRSPWLSVLAAFLTGFGAGPMYPLVLALLLNHSEAGNAGFLAGGIGASTLPMITGAVSGWTHSLRTGLGVLLTAAILILVLGSQMGAARKQSSS